VTKFSVHGMWYVISGVLSLLHKEDVAYGANKPVRLPLLITCLITGEFSWNLSQLPCH